MRRHRVPGDAGHTGRNFVYSAPTSGGKSLVADILMLNALQRAVTNWHKPRAKALVLVPYLSIGMQIFMADELLFILL